MKILPSQKYSPLSSGLWWSQLLHHQQKDSLPPKPRHSISRSSCLRKSSFYLAKYWTSSALLGNLFHLLPFCKYFKAFIRYFWEPFGFAKSNLTLQVPFMTPVWQFQDLSWKCGLFCLGLYLEMFLFKYGIWNQTNIVHMVFSTEPSWFSAGYLWAQSGPGKQGLGCFSPLVLSPPGMLMFPLESGCPGHDKTTLSQEKRCDWNFAFPF